MRTSWAVRTAPLLALGALVLGGDPSGTRPPGMCLTMLDVGQGDAALLEFPDGDPWLVDGGGAPGARFDVGLRRVLPALRSRGIDRLGQVVMTHGDLDHAGGLAAVLEHLEVDALLVPREQPGSAAERSLRALADEKRVTVHVASRGETADAPPGTTVEVLHPTMESSADLGSNDASVVLALAYGGVRMLLTGDVEAAGEASLLGREQALYADVLKVAHHGSRTSSSEAFLNRVGPLVAVGGIGENNRFGFPHQAVVARFRVRGVPFYWTGRDGEVRVCTDGLGLVVDTRASGRWTRVAERTAAQVAARAARVPVSVSASPRDFPMGGEDVARPGPPRRPATTKKRKVRPNRRSSGTSSEEQSEVPSPPVLIEPREWERSRRERKRAKPPWKSRR